MRKNLLLYVLTASIIVGSIVSGTTVYASESTDDLAISNDNTDATSNLDPSLPSISLFPDETADLISITEESIFSDEEALHPENDEPSSNTTKEKKKNYKEELITIKKDSFVADSYKGVKALYRPGKNDGSNATYSCAAYIKKFYKEVYKVSLYNLYAGRDPLTYEGNKIAAVKTPKTGDIAYANSHWAIVKSVDKDNKKVVLIEQNWKWQQDGQTVSKINRTLSWDSLTFYRLSE